MYLLLDSFYFSYIAFEQNKIDNPPTTSWSNTDLTEDDIIDSTSDINLAELNLNAIVPPSLNTENTIPNLEPRITETEINNSQVPTEATPPPPPPEPELEPEEIERRRLVALEHKMSGNHFIEVNDYDQAINRYTEGLNICPSQCPHERAVLYANRAVCYMNLQQDDNIIADCNEALSLEPDYVKARIRRARVLDRLQRYEEALLDFQEIIKNDPNNQEAKNRIAQLPLEIKEQQEKLKTEALDKLKELGNMVLKPFGLSTENFKMVQDPQSGGYNISFSQN